jgi:hypothetical protein
MNVACLLKNCHKTKLTGQACQFLLSYFICALALIEKNADCCKPAAGTKGNDETSRKVDNDVVGIGLTDLAIILRPAVLAFDVGKQPGSECAAPPRKVDFLRVVLSAAGAGGVLSWVLHNSSEE